MRFCFIWSVSTREMRENVWFEKRAKTRIFTMIILFTVTGNYSKSLVRKPRGVCTQFPWSKWKNVNATLNALFINLIFEFYSPEFLFSVLNSNLKTVEIVERTIVEFFKSLKTTCRSLLKLFTGFARLHIQNRKIVFHLILSSQTLI